MLGSIVYSIIMVAVTCFLGFLIANLVLELGLARLISKPIAPLMRFANLPEVFSIPAIISMVDSRGGLSIVRYLRDKNGMDDSVIVAYKLVTRPFSAVFLLVRHSLPIAIASLGLFVGSMYIALSFASAVICMFMGIAYSRLKAKREVREVDFDLTSCGRGRSEVLKLSLKSAFDLTKKVVLRYVVITTTIAMLMFLGLFDLVFNNIGVYMKQIGFPPDIAAVISINIFSPTSAMLMAGEFLRNGLFNIKECLTALLIGKLLFLAVMDYPRHAFPFYASILPLRLASKLVMAGLIVDAVTTPLLVAIVNLVL